MQPEFSDHYSGRLQRRSPPDESPGIPCRVFRRGERKPEESGLHRLEGNRRQRYPALRHVHDFSEVDAILAIFKNWRFVEAFLFINAAQLAQSHIHCGDRLRYGIFIKNPYPFPRHTERQLCAGRIIPVLQLASGESPSAAEDFRLRQYRFLWQPDAYDRDVAIKRVLLRHILKRSGSGRGRRQPKRDFSAAFHIRFAPAELFHGLFCFHPGSSALAPAWR